MSSAAEAQEYVSRTQRSSQKEVICEDRWIGVRLDGNVEEGLEGMDKLVHQNDVMRWREAVCRREVHETAST